jgi:hypothetical protein
VVDDEEDRLMALPHAPVPELPLTLFTVTFVQVAVTADVGTVVHPVNVEAPAWIPTVQDLVVAPPLRLKASVAAEDPVTNPKSGSVAEKLIVAGVAEMDVTLVAKTVRVLAGTTTIFLARACAAIQGVPETVARTTSIASWSRDGILRDVSTRDIATKKHKARQTGCDPVNH